ncbi:MAG: ATP-dependent DNA helicase RecG [Candidatus Dojkabacteria bacterium]|nr:MAG: ATP-dependent DNA helicase RecG [Candidatus Dojkabacteria bacterium]
MADEIQLQSPITAIPLIGPAQAGKLSRLGITTVNDLLYHFPVKYKDTSSIVTIEQAKTAGSGTVKITVDDIKMNFTRRGMVITRAVVRDESGSAGIVWFNQRFIVNSVKKGHDYFMELKLPNKPGAKDFYCNEYEEVQGEQKHLGKIVPYYDQTAGISSKWLRARMSTLQDKIDEIVTDPLPKAIIKEQGVVGLKEALHKIHFPASFEDVEVARKRLALDEMLGVARKLEKKKEETRGGSAQPIEVKGRALREFIGGLPFMLTNDQQKAIEEILGDIQKEQPMYRLLNGDVGSGKTIVAAIASYMTALNGRSTIIMAPTTILANQHYASLNSILDPEEINIQLLIAGQTLEPTMKSQIVVGTHAILFEEYLPDNTGLVIVDEQHRFGVKQREQLRQTASGLRPHYLTMTATPIPRTLANVVYGDMEVSQIREMPKDRLPIETHVVPSKKSADCYKWIHDRIVASKFDEQAFIIFPLVEESEKVDLKAATIAHEELSSSIFKELKVGLLHGRMKEEEKDKVLKDFRDKKYHVLVSTTVIEVGIDIPDASMVVIEHAERFGLAQLHQLRGRVGRGNKQSFCYVIPSPDVEFDSPAYERLNYFASHNSGFDVAEYDLISRGPGEVYGLKQSGLPDLKIADFNDVELLIKAREIARRLSS